MADTKPTAEIGLLIYPGCQLAAVHGLTDLLRIAGEWAGENAPAIRVSHWNTKDDGVFCTWDSHNIADHKVTYVIVPPSIIMPQHMKPVPEAAAWLLERHASGTTLCSVCAGAFVLAETGLMNGRRATTHWAFARQLAERFPEIKLADENIVVDEGDIMTAGGILAWTDLGLLLVERLLGPATMLATAKFLVIEPPRNSQRPFALFLPRFDHSDDAIRKSQHHIHAHASSMQGVAELAALAGMTMRTFLRRFKAATGLTPVEYLQHVRIANAREALEQTTTPVDRIAWDVGYTDPAAFRKIFQKLVAVSPAVYRQQFGIAKRQN